MQIVRSHPFLMLPLAQEPPRERAAAETANLPVPSQGAESRRAPRTVTEIRSAERMLDRRRVQDPYASMAQAGRQQRAAAAYQSLQQSDERDYVSQVLGIDVYA